MKDVVWVNVITLAEQEKEMDILGLALESTGVVLAVLILLLVFSIISWFIIVYKWVYIKRAQNQSEEFLEAFWQSKRLDKIYSEAEKLTRSPISQVFKAGYIELSKLKSQTEGQQTMSGQLGGIENIERALRRASSTEISRLESLVAFLATTGSTAPFIGLFGTVWGIMNAFLNISKVGEAGLDVVSGPIAEALIATAIGLMAAIPAVMAYNFFLSKIKTITVEMDNFSADFLNIVKRHFFK